MGMDVDERRTGLRHKSPVHSCPMAFLVESHGRNSARRKHQWMPTLMIGSFPARRLPKRLSQSGRNLPVDIRAFLHRLSDQT